MERGYQQNDSLADGSGGKSWSGITDICPDGTGDHGCLDFEAVHDEVKDTLIVQYCLGKSETKCTDMQRMSTE